MKLYNVNAEIANLIENAFCGIPVEGIVAEDGTVNTEALLEALNNASENHNDLIENLARNIQNMNSEAAAIKAEADRLAERQKMVVKRSEHCLDLLSKVLGDDSYLSDTSALRINRRKSESLIIDQEDLIGDEYKVIKTEIRVDKNKAKAALKAGKAVEGCHIEKKNSIIIK